MILKLFKFLILNLRALKMFTVLEKQYIELGSSIKKIISHKLGVNNIRPFIQRLSNLILGVRKNDWLFKP